MNALPQAKPFSIVGLVALVVEYRRTFVISVFVFVAGLVVHGFLTTRTYTSRVVVVPEASAAPGGGLGSLASRFGVSLPAGGFDRSLQFYAALARSQAVRMRAVDTPLEFAGRTTTLLDHWEVGGGSEAVRRELGARRLAKYLRVGFDIDAGSLTIAVSADDPELARAVVTRILFLIDSLNIESRQLQATSERRFLEERLTGSRAELERAERQLATFVARNRGYQSDANLQVEYDRLQRDVTGKQTVWVGLAEDYERARLGEVRQTPTINPVEPPTLPAIGDRRYMLLRLAFGTLLGILVPFAWIVGRRWWMAALDDDPAGREALGRARAAR